MHSLAAHSSAEGPHHRAIALLLQRSKGAVGDVVPALWERLSLQLAALIGQEGVKALWGRALHLASARFAWLASAETTGADAPATREALRAALAAQTLDESRQAAVLLLSVFTGLLCTLIGQNLTTNILRTAWGDAFEHAVQEVSTWSTK